MEKSIFIGDYNLGCLSIFTSHNEIATDLNTQHFSVKHNKAERKKLKWG